MRRHACIIIFANIILLATWGCASGVRQDQIPITAPVSSRALVNGMVSNTPSPTPKTHNTRSPEIRTPEIYYTITPTRVSLTSTLKPTWTLLPTLEMSKRDELILDLLKNNLSCELPCWWGMMPGRTDWYSAEHFLASFSTEIGPSVTSTTIENKVTISHMNYGVYFKNKLFEDDIATGYRTTDGIIDYIQVKSIGTELRYSLDQVLSRYGNPEDILIQALPDTNIGKPWFAFYLFYPQKGIIAEYDGEAVNLGKKLRVCPQNIGPELKLFSPQKYSLEEMAEMAGISSVRSIKDWPNLSMNVFYNTLKEPDSCIEIDFAE